MTTSTARVDTVVRNLVATYGTDRVRALLSMLERDMSGQAIGEAFGVSRERVRQWKHLLGREVRIYNVHAEVKLLLRREDARGHRLPRRISFKELVARNRKKREESAQPLEESPCSLPET